MWWFWEKFADGGSGRSLQRREEEDLVRFGGFVLLVFVSFGWLLTRSVFLLLNRSERVRGPLDLNNEVQI